MKKLCNDKLFHILITIYHRSYADFRKGYSPQNALLSLIEKWKKMIDNHGYSGAVLMDLSKAFDTLNHDFLTAKLDMYGFDKQALRLISSYLQRDGRGRRSISRLAHG